jgi:hydroxyacylglutathione hydrolase
MDTLYRFIIGLFFIVLSTNTHAQTMHFERIYEETLAQASYLIANENKEAIVIDPKRDIDTYLDFAEKNGIQIKYVTETHIHADYLSGAPALARATNATLLLSAEGGPLWRYAFPHEPLKNKQIIALGNVVIEVMHTPGHTPESVTFLIQDKRQPLAPIKAITGDFLFVGDIGRPDLLEIAAGQQGAQLEGAHQLFTSLQRFRTLPKQTEIWPGHGAGSFCGKSLSSIPHSTLEEQLATNPALQYLDDQNAFVKFIIEGQPEPPRYFTIMKQWNKQLRPSVIAIPKVPLLSLDELTQAVQHQVLVIDARKKEQVERAFIPGSLHIEGGKSFATFVGSLIDYDQQLILVAEETQVEDLQRKLMRIGFDNIYGYVSDVRGFKELKSSVIITAEQVLKWKKDPKVQLIDVRTTAEYASGHIAGFENIPLNTLEANAHKIQKDNPVIIHCQSGVRSATAYSILEQLGYTNILNYSGSINDWNAKQLPLVK